MIVNRIAAIAFGAVLALGAAAAAPAGAAEWVVDGDMSRLGFVGTQTGSRFEGAFDRFEADITFDPDNLDAGAVTVVIAVDSFATGNGQRDEIAKSAEWFNVAEYPEARFATTGFRRVGEGRYEADADLTMRGVTRPVVLPFTLEIDGDTARMHGELTVDRVDYGIGQGQWEAGDAVGREVTIVVDLTAVRAQ